MIDCRTLDCPMVVNQKLMAEHDESFSDPERYKRPIIKFIYLLQLVLVRSCRLLAMIIGMLSYIS